LESIFVFISGAMLLVYSAERLIDSLVGAAAGLKISLFLLAIVFTGIEFDDIVLGVALELEELEGVALGLVLGTAVAFTGVVLALGAILTPTKVRVPSDYIVIFAAAPLIMVVFALAEPINVAEGVVLLGLFAVFVAYVTVREVRRETPTFRNLEVLDEAAELRHAEVEAEEKAPAPSREQAVAAMMPFGTGLRHPGWPSLGMAVLALAGIVIGAATVSTGTEGILEEYELEGTLFGATIITAVLTIEDLFLTVEPIRRGVPEIGVGNVIGSLIFTVTGKLGVIVIAGGSVAVGSNVLNWHLPALVAVTAVAALILYKGELKRWHGYLLLGLYVAYWVISYVVYDGPPVEAD
jgi:cation:H+ antiporter